MAEEDTEKLSAAARLFDVRRVIGGLFVVYGVIVTVIGLFDNQAEIDKAQGVRINLWMGLGMLALGLLMLLWLRLNPPKALDPADLTEDDDRPPAHCWSRRCDLVAVGLHRHPDSCTPATVRPIDPAWKPSPPSATPGRAVTVPPVGNNRSESTTWSTRSCRPIEA